MKKYLLIRPELTASILVSCVFVVGCQKVEYDYRSLGFSSTDEMNAAHQMGYHTKVKLDEMVKPAKVALPQQAPVLPNQKAPEPSIQQAAIASVVSIDESCTALEACIVEMLNAGRAEKLSSLLQIAKRIDEFPKPVRGERIVARELNQVGLNLLNAKDAAGAIEKFAQAHNADQGDEEIIANYVFALVQGGQFQSALKFTNAGLLLNPRKTTLWFPSAIAQLGLGNEQIAYSTAWVAWQFSSNREKTIGYLQSKEISSTDERERQFYKNLVQWFLNGIKPINA